jgi:hypothetical protein
MRAPAIRVVLHVVLSLIPSFLAAQEIPNWTVPPYRGSSASGGLSTMTDISPGIAFVAMSPCRVFDTRNANGAYGGPRLLANVTRNFDIDSGPCTGIPAGVDAYSMNFGAILADGIGFVTIWPTGVTRPTVSSINTIPGYVLANAAVVPAGTNGSISVFPNTGMHLYGDINGYFTDQYNPNISFHAVSSGDTTAAIIGDNTSGLGFAIGVLGRIPTATTGSGSAGVRGINSGTGAAGVGVWGSHAASGWGVYGEAVSGVGVYGKTTAATGASYGVWGQTSGIGAAAGVFGVDVDGVTAGHVSLASSSGVRGESRNGNGVLGVNEFGSGVTGVRVDPANGNAIVQGFLGFNSYGVYSIGDAHVSGTFTATTKSFVQPHPTDPGKEIRYVSLEGPHSEVYFRGSAQISQGVTRIPVPDYFRMVATPGSYSALVTPVGAMATVAVLSKGEEGIVVQASRDVRIDYVVYAERDAVRQDNPIVENVHFRPNPEIDLLAHVPETYRQLMIRNGTLNSDGSPNMETARRLGWDKEWEKRGRPAPRPSD